MPLINQSAIFVGVVGGFLSPPPVPLQRGIEGEDALSPPPSRLDIIFDLEVVLYE